MANVTGRQADKRTAEERHNDTVNMATKPTANNTPENYVTTGPATKKTDDRVLRERADEENK